MTVTLTKPTGGAPDPPGADPAADAALVRVPRIARRRRYAAVVTLLVAVGVAVATVSLSTGELTVSAPDVALTLVGRGTELTDYLVFELRLPRVVLAATAGAALALSGAMFQSMLHNPLASPDILGVTAGASFGVSFGVLVLGWSGLALSGLAGAGALAVAVVVYLLAWDGTLAGNRFVLIGIGLAFMTTALTELLLTRAETQDAQVAISALVGGVGNATDTGNAVTAGALAVLLLPVAVASPSLRVLQLGDDTADGLGVPADSRRRLLLGLAVLLAAVGVAGAGPLAFVAFMSAPIARRLLRDGSPALVPAALVGAVLVLLADLVAVHLVPGGAQLPAGVLTGAIGAPYLIWLLIFGSRPTGSAS